MFEHGVEDDEEFTLLPVGQFGWLAAQCPPGAGDGYALADAHAYEIGLELGVGLQQQRRGQSA